MKIFDSHIHIFNDTIIGNVKKKPEMVRQLKLRTGGAEKRNNVKALSKDMKAAGVTGALLLPTANAAGVHSTNSRCIEIASRTDYLKTAGTLHPEDPELAREIAVLQEHRIRIIKMCSFSQGFALNGPAALEMFDTIQEANKNTNHPFAVVLDTLYSADRHFGTRPEFNTHPRLLAELADRYPRIKFIGAHMGGLNAPYDKIRTHLTPRSNLFLDTSNAAHILTEKQFCDLSVDHGPHHVLFGTDWPWFIHKYETALIDGLLDLAGFSDDEKRRVFHGNITGLL